MNYQPRGLLTRLEKYEVEYASVVARRRTYENRFKRHIYPPNMPLQDQAFAELAGCCCEMAVAKTVNQYWRGLVWNGDSHTSHKKMADVGNEIEVKRIREPNNPLVFSDYDMAENRIVVLTYCLGVTPDDPQETWVDLIGWGRAQELNAERAYENRWKVPQRDLKPFNKTLRDKSER